jgi:diguanylate cyclase (GGDEF)-like protein
VDLGAVLDRSEQVVNALIGDKPVKLSCTRAPGLPARWRGDGGKLERVLVTLLNDAIGRIPIGRVELSVREEQVVGTRGNLLFSIQGGNPAPNPGTRFTGLREQDPPSGQQPIHGDGDPHVVRRLIGEMGGELRVVESAEAGFSLSFALPLAKRRQAAPRAEPIQSVELTDAETAASSRAKPILVAEDNRINQVIAQELLERMGLLSRVAANGRETLDILQADPDCFSLVLMDMRMPVMDGYECTRAIRADPRLTHLPVVAMTAHALNGDREKCLAAGANDYLSKPIDRTHFVRTLRRWLPVDAQQPRVYSEEGPATGDTTPQSDSHPVLDVEAGLAWTDGDEKLYAQLAVDFIRSYNDKLKLLEPDTVDLHMSEIQTLAHTLKSSAAILGAGRLREHATRLDASIKETGSLAPQAVTDLRNQLNAVIEALREHLHSSSGPEEQTADPESQVPASGPQEADAISGKGRVLIVDDERINQKLLSEVLAEENDLLVADDGERGIELAHRSPQPDLILLDIVMPGIDGYEVCRRLKEDPETAAIPIVFISGNISNEDERRGLQLGAIDYIRKPFNSLVVKARVRNHVAFKRQADMLEQLSLVDGLTGIANRRRLDEYLNQAWHNATRNGTNIALMMMDIDHFKRYNDHYGHGAGDDCLRRVAQALDELCWRKTELVARYGGEEFAWVLLDTDREEVMALAEKVLGVIRRLRIPHETGSAEGIVSMSIGVAATVPTPERHLDDFINTADQHLYQAKAEGRDRAVG